MSIHSLFIYLFFDFLVTFFLSRDRSLLCYVGVSVSNDGSVSCGTVIAI